MSGHRTAKVAGELQRAIQNVLTRGLSDPRMRGIVTVTKVTVSGDLRDATAFISVMPHEHEKLTHHAIKDAARHIRHEAGELVALRRMPELHFKLDASMRKQAEIIEALAKEHQRSAQPGASDDDENDRGPAAEGPVS
jgi:ribosome-binding factor A